MSQEVRDAVARLEGWTTYRASNGLTVLEFGSIEDGTYTTATDHPIADDLTACAKAWDRHAGKHGWRWTRHDRDGNQWWRIYNFDNDESFEDSEKIDYMSSGHDAASELRDRWELLGLVIKARGVV